MQMKLPTDIASNHLIFEVHSYIDVKNINNAKSEALQMMHSIKNNLATKGAPVIFGEWGTETEGAYDSYRSNMIAYARYFVEQAKINGFGTFYWMGLSDGIHRSVPEFNQPDLKDAIIKGYYGENGYTGITPAISSETTVVTASYDLRGYRLPSSQQDARKGNASSSAGLNIVRMSNGIVRKTMK